MSRPRQPCCVQAAMGPLNFAEKSTYCTEIIRRQKFHIKCEISVGVILIFLYLEIISEQVVLGVSDPR